MATWLGCLCQILDMLCGSFLLCALQRLGSWRITCRYRVCHLQSTRKSVSHCTYFFVSLHTSLTFKCLACLWKLNQKHSQGGTYRSLSMVYTSPSETHLCHQTSGVLVDSCSSCLQSRMSSNNRLRQSSAGCTGSADYSACIMADATESERSSAADLPVLLDAVHSVCI